MLFRLELDWRKAFTFATACDGWCNKLFVGGLWIVPTLPALALVRCLLDGRIVETGAVACTGLLALSDITAEFARFRIHARTMH